MLDDEGDILSKYRESHMTVTQHYIQEYWNPQLYHCEILTNNVGMELCLRLS
jgi:hypothetical protein